MRDKTFLSDNGLVEKIGALISANFELPPDFLPLHAETRLYGSGISLDSFDALRLVAALEEKFDITHRRRGIDALHIRERGLHHLPDPR